MRGHPKLHTNAGHGLLVVRQHRRTLTATSSCRWAWKQARHVGAYRKDSAVRRQPLTGVAGLRWPLGGGSLSSGRTGEPQRRPPPAGGHGSKRDTSAPTGRTVQFAGSRSQEWPGSVGLWEVDVNHCIHRVPFPTVRASCSGYYDEPLDGSGICEGCGWKWQR